MSKSYSKNVILCGDIDYFCLLCEEALRCESDVESHIRWENHRKLFKNITYIAKFKGDFIIKTKNHYYCEVCNSAMSTLMKTALHIKDEKHIHCKQHPKTNNDHQTAPVKRNGGSVTISDIILTEKEWNGIIDNQCLMCDLELTNIKEHMNSQPHVINLVQSKTEKNLEFYRRIGSDIFFCFTCKEPVFLSEMEHHWVSKEHVNKKKKSADKQMNNEASCSTSSSESFSAQFKNNMRTMFDSPKASLIKDINKDVSAITNNLEEFQKENIEINFERSKATCKQCNFSPAFTVKDIQGHIKMHKQAEVQFQIESEKNLQNPDENEETESESAEETVNAIDGIIDYGLIRARLAKYGRKHFIKLVLSGSKGKCTICNSLISAHIKNFKQHVKGAQHKTKLLNENKETYETTSMSSFARCFSFIAEMDVIWLNRKLAIYKYSFQTFCHLDNNAVRCYVCNTVFPKEMDKKHWSSKEHYRKLFVTKVITSFKNEFVREIRCRSVINYQCGFCNVVTVNYALMEEHLKTYDHRKKCKEQNVISSLARELYPDSDDSDSDSSLLGDMIRSRLMNLF